MKEAFCLPVLLLDLMLIMTVRFAKLFKNTSVSETTFAHDGSILFRNEVKPFYWLEMTLVRKLINRMASKTMFARDGSVLFQSEMKPFY